MTREMNKLTIAALLLLLAVAGSTLGAMGTSQHEQSFEVFWTKFKTAVFKRNMRGVATLTKFPLGIGETLPAVENASELGRRFDAVFKNEVDAAQCFATKTPSPDTEIPDRYTVVCPYNEGKDGNSVVYEFDYTDSGWKFIHRQYPTKCRCR